MGVTAALAFLMFIALGIISIAGVDGLCCCDGLISNYRIIMSAAAAAAAAPSSDEKKVVYAPGSAGTGNQKLIGLLGGIAWASSAEYYKLLNEEMNGRLGKAHSARVIMNSLDLQPYLEALNNKDYNKVKALIG